MKMMIRIEILDGPEKAVDHSFQETRLRFGSSGQNQVILSGEGVHPQHASIELSDDQGTLVPAQDGVSISVNGTQVDGPTLLQPGDQISLGEQTFFFKLIPFPQPMKNRRVALLEWVTILILLSGGLFQVFFLLGPALRLRSKVDVQLLRATPTPRPTPNAMEIEPEPTPVPISQIALPAAMPTQMPEGVPTPTPIPGSEGLSISERTREAQKKIQEKDELNAERILEDVVNVDPQYLPALMELARLKGRQSDYAQSIELWKQVQSLAPAGSMERMDARLELRVMQRRKDLLEQKLPEVPRAIPTPRAPKFIPTPAFPEERPPLVEAKAQIEIDTLRMERFPESPRYDQFRMIHFGLEHQTGTPAVIPGEITVSVTFFEQVGSQVLTAKIPEPRIILKLDEGLAGGNRIGDLSAAYDVPTGKGSPDRSYYGTVIQVFVDGKEINRAADPRFLLDYIR